jgi:hypothetical protein
VTLLKLSFKSEKARKRKSMDDLVKYKVLLINDELFAKTAGGRAVDSLSVELRKHGIEVTESTTGECRCAAAQ